MTVLAVLESALPSSCLSYKIQFQETTMTVLTVSAVSAVVAVSVVTATPLKLNPPFRHPEEGGHKLHGSVDGRSAAGLHRRQHVPSSEFCV